MVLDVGARPRTARGALRVHLDDLRVRRRARRRDHRGVTDRRRAPRRRHHRLRSRQARCGARHRERVRRRAHASSRGPGSSSDRARTSAVCPGGCVASRPAARCSRPDRRTSRVQYVDARDLAAFAIETALNGAVNVLSRPGHTTMARDARALPRGHRVERVVHAGSTRSSCSRTRSSPGPSCPSGCPRSATWPASTLTDSSLALAIGTHLPPRARHRRRTRGRGCATTPTGTGGDRQSLARRHGARSARRRCSPPGRISRRQPGSAAGAGRPARRSGSRRARRGCGSRRRGSRR